MYESQALDCLLHIAIGRTEYGCEFLGGLGSAEASVSLLLGVVSIVHFPFV